MMSLLLARADTLARVVEQQNEFGAKFLPKGALV